MKNKNYKLILGLFLLLVTLIFIVSSYILILRVPVIVEQYFGAAASNLDRSKKILLSAKLLIHKKDLLSINNSSTQPQTFIIENGESASSVAFHLEEINVIPNADLLINYWIYKGQDRLVQSGVYLIQPKINPLEIAKSLVNSEPDKIHFAFLPGWRMEEIEHLLKASTIFPQEISIKDLETEVLDECFPQEMKYLPSINGFLFPGEYQIPIDISPKEILCLFSDRFFESLPNNYEEDLKENSLTLYEALILASIVQKEVIVPEEAPIIAGIFVNRFSIDMLLQSDPTVQYAIANGSDGWWKSPLDAVDLAVNSPFNTYLYQGLPPTPICNPDLNSLTAVAHPTKTDYLFFRAACDGSGRHIFSQTYQQHLDAACE